MAELMSEAETLAPMSARGIAREPTPQPASANVFPLAAEPSSLTQLSTWESVEAQSGGAVEASSHTEVAEEIRV
jgi:hypothetical protein